jgi:hypothetical protein
MLSASSATGPVKGNIASRGFVWAERAAAEKAKNKKLKNLIRVISFSSLSLLSVIYYPRRPSPKLFVIPYIIRGQFKRLVPAYFRITLGWGPEQYASGGTKAYGNVADQHSGAGNRFRLRPCVKRNQKFIAGQQGDPVRLQGLLYRLEKHTLFGLAKRFTPEPDLRLSGADFQTKACSGVPGDRGRKRIYIQFQADRIISRFQGGSGEPEHKGIAAAHIVDPARQRTIPALHGNGTFKRGGV